MKRPLLTSALALGIALASGWGAARGDAPTGGDLILEQALSMARRANKSLVAERIRLDEARTTVEQAWTVLFPTVAVQGRYTHNYKAFQFGGSPRFDVYGQPVLDPATGFAVPVPGLNIQPVEQLDGMVNFTLPLLVPAAYAGLKAVKMTERATQENVQVTEDSILFTVAQTFYTAGIADEVLVVRRSAVAVARATLQNAKDRFEAGTVTKVDVDRAEVALLRGEQLEREARLGREQTYRVLGTLIQAPGPFKVRIVEIDVPRPESYPPVREELATALRLRPEFLGLEASLQAEVAERRAYGWRWAPTLSGFGNARIFNYDNFARDSHSWALGAQLDWVIYDAGVRDVQRRLAGFRAQEAQARAEALSDSIRDDLANGRRQLETKQQARQTAERSVDLAREALELVRTQYEAGVATQIDLLQAQASLVVAQEDLAQAHYDIAIADLTLKHAAGTFPGR